MIQVSRDYAGDEAAATWITLADGVSALTRATVPAANGISQVFRVATVTTNGQGAFSAPSPAFMPIDPLAVPAAPSITQAMSPQVGRAKLTWTEPPANEGGPVSGYVVRYRLAGTITWRTVSRSTPLVVFQGLVSGRDYQFQVQAENEAGLGSPSEIVTVRIL